MLLDILIDLALYERNSGVPLFLKLRESVPEHITTTQLIKYIIATYLNKPQFSTCQTWSASVDEFQLPLRCTLSQIIRPTDVIKLAPCLSSSVFSDTFSYAVDANHVKTISQSLNYTELVSPIERNPIEMVNNDGLSREYIGQVTLERKQPDNTATAFPEPPLNGLKSDERRWSNVSGPEVSQIIRQIESLNDNNLNVPLCANISNTVPPQTATPLSVPPGKGSKSTQSRNARRRANRKLVKIENLQDQVRKQNEQNLNGLYNVTANEDPLVGDQTGGATVNANATAGSTELTDTPGVELLDRPDKVQPPIVSYKRKLILTSYECDQSYSFRNGTAGVPPFPFEYQDDILAKNNSNKRKKQDYNDLEVVLPTDSKTPLHFSENSATEITEPMITVDASLQEYNTNIISNDLKSESRFNSDSDASSESDSDASSESDSDASSESDSNASSESNSESDSDSEPDSNSVL